ncbi:hypothetical protein D3C85_1545030 [compost metagenome]
MRNPQFQAVRRLTGLEITLTEDWVQLRTQSLRQLHEGVTAVTDVVDYQPVHVWTWFEVEVHSSTGDLASGGVTVFKAADDVRTTNQTSQFEGLLHSASIGSYEYGVSPRPSVGFVTTSHGFGNDLW